MKKNHVIFLIVGVLFLSGILYMYKEYHRPNKILSDVEPAVKISGAELLVSFVQNDSLANQQFLGKVIEIKGVVKAIEMPESSISTIVLSGAEAMSSIRCTMDSSFNRKSFSVDSGSLIVIRGICTGYNADELLGSDVLLNRCVIVNRKE